MILRRRTREEQRSLLLRYLTVAGTDCSLVDGGDWDAGNDAGDGWLLRNGYSVASLGWQWDATGDGLFVYMRQSPGKWKDDSWFVTRGSDASKVMEESRSAT
jgi:hypothetical protein